MEEVLPIFLAGGQCVCRCTCPTSGSFQYQYQYQYVDQPAGGCGSLNGQACNFLPASFCVQQDIFTSYVPEVLAPAPCR